MKVPPTLYGMSLLVFDERLDERPVDARLPEAIGTMVDAAGSFRYVTGQNWQMSRDGAWSYDGTSRQRFNSTKRDIDFSGEVSCAARLEGDTLTAELTVRNGDFATWTSVYLWVCVMYTPAPAMDSKTLVSVEGKLAPYEETWPDFFGPAGMRALTVKGLREVERLESEGRKVKCPFPRDIVADPIRAARPRAGSDGPAVVVWSGDAVLLGGYDKNPCTDLALGFGDIGPGQRATCSVNVRFTEEPLDDMIKGLSTDLGQRDR